MIEMDEKVVSIIMPAYNTAAYLERALVSIQQCLRENYEVWLIDDGSEDNTLQRLQDFAEQRTNIHVISQKNSGPAYARNVGLMHANGKYIYFIDSDDYIEPNGIEILVQTIEQDQADVVVSGIYEEISNIRTEIQYSTHHFQSREEYLRHAVQLWDTHLLYTMGNKLYRASFLKAHNICFPKEYVFGEDMRFNMQVFEAAQKISVLSESYYHYVRERPGSTTTLYKKDLFEIRNIEYEMFWEYFRQQDLLTEEGIEYLSRRHAERIAGCVVNLFLPGNRLSTKNRIYEIKKISNGDYTKGALKYAKLRSRKMKFILWPVKWEMTFMTYIFGAVIAFMQNEFPGIYLKMKSMR